jgi:hypothetical protein
MRCILTAALTAALLVGLLPLQALAGDPQVIAFDSTPPNPGIVGEAYVVSATGGGSSNPVTFTIDGSSSSVCTIATDTVSFIGAGTCTINADQAGDGTFDPAPTTPQNVTVRNAQATLAVTGPAGATYGAADATITTSGGSGTGELTFDAGSSTACSIVAGKLHVTSATGTCAVTATRAADADYAAATSAPFPVTIGVGYRPVDARNDSAIVTATTTTVIDVIRASSPTGTAGKDDPGAGDTRQPLTITAVTPGNHGRVTTNGTTVTYDPTGCATGGDLFSYTISDGQSADTAYVVVTIARPGSNGLSSNPITDTPSLGFIANSTIGSTVPARLSWCGVTRSGFSVRSYTVGQSTNGGSSYASTPIVRNSTVRSTTRNLTVGKTYRWRARTTDSAGRAGAYKASLTSRIARFQESSTAFVYAGAWSRTATSNAAGGAQQSTSTAGASATITLTNVRQFAVVGPRSAGRGSFEVRVDGALVAIVSEKATTTVYRRVLYVRSLTSGPGVSHVIEIRAVGNGRIDLDAILALS